MDTPTRELSKTFPAVMRATMRMQPGLQWIENPGGITTDAPVVGLRLHLEL